MKGSLGTQPWAPARISATCNDLDHKVRELDEALTDDRELMSYEEFQQTLDMSARTKENLGYKLPRHRDGTIDLDATVKQKYEQTQVMMRAYNQYMGYDAEEAGAADRTPNQSPNTFVRRQQKWEESQASGTFHQPFLAAAACVALSLAMLGVIGGAALCARRMPRRNVSLLQPCKQEQLNPPGSPVAEEAGGNIE